MKKNILIVDDSALMRRVLCDIINTEQRFEAKDICRDGLEAYERLKKTSYDAVLLDINMPNMDGLELLDCLNRDGIKATIIVVSTSMKKDAAVTMLAMEKGAVDFVKKPDNIIEAKGEEFKKHLLDILEAVLFKKTTATRTEGSIPHIIGAPKSARHLVKRGGSKVIALACSTGGPKALQSVIPFLPENLDAPVVMVQHMPMGFTKTMADRLNQISKIEVKEAENGEMLRKGCVYVAPGGKHMEIVKMGAEHKILLNDQPAIGGLKPCADVMYESLKNSAFDSITCVIMTGMGTDGTKGILSLRQTKPLYVIAQNEATCVVYGMPKSVVEAGVVNEVVPLTEIAQSIIKNVGVE